ncbi:MAG: sodium/solute symporter [Verrucomicrobiae bacterium]|nr:sodium/solute symporter [Verrucomicrobiae bacterium]MCB1091667.1 sodium/solute symporter [Verrucomicrobiae bacterium]
MDDFTAAIANQFSLWDWAVVAGYLLLTTAAGHLMRGKQATIRDFFLGGRSLPWTAVAGSIIATEISGVTFIGVPGMLFAMNGDFTYLQWAIGSIIARVIVGFFFVRVYYEQEIYSPYDYMGLRLGNAAKTMATVLFTVGSILAQSVRVLVAAIPLKVVTGLPMEVCIIAIGLFAVIWTLMGGMRTVIWTDVMQFGLFAFGGLTAFLWIVTSLDGGLSDFWHTASEYGRLKLWNLSIDKELEFTLWVALLAVPFQNLGIYGTDQLMAQRMFCCRDASAARKAIIFSCTGQALTLLMLLVGAALFVHYQEHPFTDPELATLFEADASKVEEIRNTATLIENPVTHAKSAVIKPAKPDYIFPMWIVTELPRGLSGLILAAVFAAAISSLDSILAALSQTTLSLIYHPERGEVAISEQALLRRSRILVIMWGIILTVFTLILKAARNDIPILPLAFGMTSYTVGPLLAMFLAALWGFGKGSMRGIVIGSIVSFLLVMMVRTDVWALVLKAKWLTPNQLASLPTYELSANGESITSTISYVWMWPITTVITLLCAWLTRKGSSSQRPE